MAASILVTGGAGYIGSHTCLRLLEQGHRVTVIDDFSNSHPLALERVRGLSGRELTAVELDLRDGERLTESLAASPPDAVIHFAGRKAVGESVAQPLRYYDVNVAGTLRLCEAMAAVGCRRIVFSSSATVYGDPGGAPAREDAPLGPTNPYGRSKLMVEQLLGDVAAAEGWGVTLLRYFNPVGAHPSGQLGEDPAYPANLVPFVAQVAAGLRPEVTIFGDDWPTPDGTGVRDYIHVMDLADAHLAALDEQLGDEAAGTQIYNVGSGSGASVREVIEAFRRASGQPIPAIVGPRRAGDVASVTADPARIREQLGWQTTRDLEAMVASAWRWQQQNPRGYRG